VVFKCVETGMWGADIYLHNTMSMPGHIHLILLLGPLLFAFAIMYAIIPDLTKKKMNKTLGEIHFWLTLFGGFGFAFLFVFIGGQGAIRREASMPGAFDWAMPWLLFFALNIGLAQFVLVYNFVKTVRRKPTKLEMTEYDRLHANPTSQGITAGGAP
jgi:cytochrome c oxidase subunit 1